MKNKYSYQIRASKSIVEMTLSRKYKASVLAASAGSGKSTIAVSIINELVKKFPEYKVVILTHNQNILKDQMLDNLSSPNTPVEFTFGEFGSNTQVEVGIPSSSSKISKIDVLIVDEAHQYYSEPMVNAIINKFSPKHQILMTGSPSCFVKHNEDVDKSIKKEAKFGIHFVAANDLGDGIFSAVDLDVVRYDGSNMLEKVKEVFSHARSRRYNMTKVMWACSSINEANEVSALLKSNFKRDVFLSTSEYDVDSSNVERFKKSKNGILVVVNKGILGFSENTITSLVDFKCSPDLDNRNQLFARVLRVHPKGIKKAYISVSNSKNWNKEGKMLHSLVSFMNRKVFTAYNGKTTKV